MIRACATWRCAICATLPRLPSCAPPARRPTTTGPIAAILRRMNKAGYWAAAGPGYNPKYRSTVWSIILLAQLGASAEEDARIQQACAYVLDHTLTDSGQFSTSGAPVRHGRLPAGQPVLGAAGAGLRRPAPGSGLRLDGAQRDRRRHRPISDRSAAVRYYAGKCGPTFACGANNKLPCAWGGAKVMLALADCPRQAADAARQARHPARRRFPVQRRSGRGDLPVRLGREAERQLVEVRLPGVLRHRPAADRRGAGGAGLRRRPAPQAGPAAHPREAGRARRAGRWSTTTPARPGWTLARAKQPNKWVTLRALRVLKMAAAGRRDRRHD